MIVPILQMKNLTLREIKLPSYQLICSEGNIQTQFHLQCPTFSHSIYSIEIILAKLESSLSKYISNTMKCVH